MMPHEKSLTLGSNVLYVSLKCTDTIFKICQQVCIHLLLLQRALGFGSQHLTSTWHHISNQKLQFQETHDL